MAVYKRSYQAYQGRVTPRSLRFLVIPRFAFQDLLRSRIVLAFFVGCFVAPLAGALFVYLRYNLRALELLQLPLQELAAIDSGFFFFLLSFQSFLSFVMVILVGPGLISMDLANNALPLYLCRPFTRSDYVVGKMSVLVVLLSLITWVPLTALVLFHSSLAGWSWLLENLRIPLAILAGASVLILVLSLLGLAISAWVKWRPVAGALIAGMVFVMAGFAQAVNEILGTTWGNLFNLGLLLETLWSWFFDMESSTEMSVGQAIFGLLTICAVSLLLLSRKLRAYEVVK